MIRLFLLVIRRMLGTADAWSIAKNDQEDLLNRFGNLTLLWKEHKYKARNIGFKDKPHSIICKPMIVIKMFYTRSTVI